MRFVIARRVFPSVTLLITATLAACGGSATPNTTAPLPPPPATGANAITISPFDQSGTDTAATGGQAIFPAPDPQGVLALAAQRPNGRVRYSTMLDGAQAEMTILRSGPRGVVSITRDSNTVRVGVNLDDASIAWVCVTEGAARPVCRRQDIDDQGSSALATAALLVGEDRLRQIVTRITGAADAYLEVTKRAGGVDASCLTGTAAGAGDLRLCVTPSGFVTDIEEGPTRATAIEVSPNVQPSELEPTAAF